MKKTELTAIIFVLVVLNGWLLYNNHQKNRLIDELSSTNRPVSWELETVDRTKVYLSNKEVEIPDRPISLLVFFSDQGCQSCMEDEVRFLNAFREENNNAFKVYLQTQRAPTYLTRMFGADFEYTVIDPQQNIFNVDFELVNPISVLVDSTGLVHRMHKAEVGNSEKSEVFYHQMKTLFDN
ncbi:MAG: hypothetical protein AAFW89_13970 [Bacteroidota bacterium]